MKWDDLGYVNIPVAKTINVESSAKLLCTDKVTQTYPR